MKQSFWLVRFSVGFSLCLIAFSASPALADSVDQYIRITSVTFTSSTISVQWDKASSTSMSNEQIYLDAGFPISFAFPSGYTGGGGAHWYQISPTIVGNLSPAGGGACAAGWDSFTSASSTGNSATFSDVYDPTTMSEISVSAIPSSTPIYAVLTSQSWGTVGGTPNQCTEATTTYQDSIQIANFSPYGAFSFIYPSPSSTLSDFSDWQIQFPSVGVSPGTLSVNYSPAAGYIGSSGTDTASFSPFVNTSPLAIPKSQPLFFPPIEPPIIYNATATLYDSSGSVQLVATSTFTIIAPYVGTSTPVSTSSLCGTIPPAFFGTTSSQPYFYVESPIPDIQYGLCSSFIFLFLPSTPQQADIQTRASAIGAIIEKKPPVGYFSQAITAMGSFVLSSSSTSTVLDATSSEEIYSIYEPLDAGVAAIIGFMLLLWFFNRGRHFNP